MQEELFRPGENEFASIFNNIADGIILADPKTKRFYNANKSFCVMLGYSIDELKILSVMDIHPQKDLPYVLDQFDRQFKNEITVAKNIPVKRKNGSIFYADINSAPFRFGGREYLLGIFRDITEKRFLEEAIRESEQNYRSMVEITSDWVWEVDADGIYIYSSPNVHDILGYEPEEVIGKKPFDLMPEEEAERVSKIFSDIVRAKKPFKGLENINRSKNGNLIILETSGVPITDKDGNLTGFRGIDRDVTERKQMEAVLKESEAQYRIISENSGTSMCIMEGDMTVS
ncbi:MAG: PAS domain-containing protein, partial [Candidatus Omnitrophica bacterium]|nr:PAS domain-containing protein [Candidatus Omnitrophota bacterium]